MRRSTRNRGGSVDDADGAPAREAGQADDVSNAAAADPGSSKKKSSKKRRKSAPVESDDDAPEEVSTSSAKQQAEDQQREEKEARQSATRQEKERKKHKKFDDAEDAEAQPAWTAEQEWNEGEAENAEEEVAEELPLDFLQAAARQQRQVISDALKSADLHKKKKNKKKKEASLVKKVGNFRVKVLEAHDPFALIGREQSAAMDFLANSRSGDKRVPTILGLVGRKATGPAPKFSK